MLFNTVSLRRFLSNYKEIIEQAKKNRKPVIKVNQNKSQVALISLHALKDLQNVHGRKSTKALLDLAGLIPKCNGLPRDLSKKHSKYAWD